MLYRSVLCVACLSALVVESAPPADSGVTFIKTIPFDRLNDQAHQHRSPFRESRIEIPLTIPGKIDERPTDHQKLTKTIQNDTISAENLERSAEKSTKTHIINEQDVLDEHNLEETNRHVRDTTDTTISFESETPDTTEALEREEQTDAVLQKTEEYETRTKAPAPRFLSKLSYFKGDNQEDKSTSIFTNLVERASKKRFKSKCRCEKIWNCPKLQITVPRCPNEYFLCCF